MRISIVTLFPELFDSFFATSMVGRAATTGALVVDRVQLRDFGLGKHKSVDDTPYGGGSGMVLRVEPIAAALAAIDARADGENRPRAHRVLLTPQGAPFRQPKAHALAALPHVALICGRYEGFDERVRGLVHDEVSLGDFVMTGGEVAAMAIVEATSRLLPGVLGNESSADFESHSVALDGRLEYPQYTRPPVFEGSEVPAVLLSGDHAKIDAWRQQQAIDRTRTRRPDLLAAPKKEE
jgi:tRNA (guanine37-N1)-methyltransferase